MSDLKIDIAALNQAATAARTAKSTLADVSSSIAGQTHLDDSAFTSKGEAAASWYEKECADMAKFLENSSKSYGDLASVFTTSGTLMALLDLKMAEDAKNHGGK